MEREEPDKESKIFQISHAVYTTFNGDDVEYEPNEKDQNELIQLIKLSIDTSDLKDEDGDPIKYFDELGDDEYVENNLTEEQIDLLYNAMKEKGIYF